jgi:hypothetical protein
MNGNIDAWLTGSLSGAGFTHNDGYGVPLQLANYLNLPFNKPIEFIPERKAKTKKRTLSDR